MISLVEKDPLITLPLGRHVGEKKVSHLEFDKEKFCFILVQKTNASLIGHF